MSRHQQDDTDHVQPHADAPVEEQIVAKDTPTESNAVVSEERPVTHGKLMVARAKNQKTGKLAKFAQTVMRHKIISVLVVVIAVCAAVMAIPTTRYMVLGLVVQEQVTVTVLDSTTNLPVSNAAVQIAGKSVVTDDKGLVTLKVPVGNKTISTAKQYYQSKTQKALVTLSTRQNSFMVHLVATGRQVPVTVKNTITGAGLMGAVVSAQGSTAKTDKDGKAIIVLPTTAANYPVTVSLEGYNQRTATVTVTTDAVPGNQYVLTPTGHVYFLSNANGKIDIVSTDLDGANRKTIIAGTGNEDRYATNLMQSKDGKYLALYAQREGKAPKLYLVETATSKLTVMDEGTTASFQMIGWSDHYFVYVVQRSGYNAWQPRAQALKSFNAETAKINVLDESQATGTNNYDYTYNIFGTVTIMPDGLVYGCTWYANYWSGYLLAGKSASLQFVKPDGTGKRSIQSFTMPSASYFAINTYPYAKPSMLYVLVNDATGGSQTVYVYNAGKLTASPSTTSQQVYMAAAPTYLLSPNGQKTLWSDSRDGKNVLFVGDSKAENSKQIGSFTDQSAYGWSGDAYILTSKKGSELYIMSADGGNQIKITDYFSSPGYRGY